MIRHILNCSFIDKLLPFLVAVAVLYLSLPLFEYFTLFKLLCQVDLILNSDKAYMTAFSKYLWICLLNHNKQVVKAVLP